MGMALYHISNKENHRKSSYPFLNTLKGNLQGTDILLDVSSALEN